MAGTGGRSRRRGPDRAHQLSFAILDLCGVVSHHPSLWSVGAGVGSSADGGFIRHTNRHQSLVAETFPIRPHGMAVAWHDLRQFAGVKAGTKLV